MKRDALFWLVAGILFLLVAIRDAYFPGFLGQNSSPPSMFVLLGVLLIGLAIWSLIRSKSASHN